MFKALLVNALGDSAPNVPSDDEDIIERHAEKHPVENEEQENSRRTLRKRRRKLKLQEGGEEEKLGVNADLRSGTGEEDSDEEYELPSDGASSEEDNMEGEVRIRTPINSKPSTPSKRKRSAFVVPKPLRRRRQPKLSRELQAIIGEANMEFAAGNFDKAISLLKEFIQKAPTIPNPYHTLGMIYEEMNDRSNAIQFYLIAATLTNTDGDLWKRVAQMAREDGDLDQALHCFKKAAAANPKDIQALLSRAEIFEETNAHHKAAEMYERIAVLRPQDLSIWLHVAQCYHSEGFKEDALKALKSCIKACIESKDTTKEMEDAGLNAVNMASDLLITMKRHQDAIEIIQKWHTFMLASTSKESSGEGGENYSLPIDIAVKFGICHVHLKDWDPANNMFKHLFTQSGNDFGDLYMDVAEAYVDVEEFLKAKNIYIQLVDTPFANDILWTKLGYCHENLKLYKEAYDYYKKAIMEQFEMEEKSVNPNTVLALCELCLRLKEEKEGIHCILNNFPEVFNPILQPKLIRRMRKAKKDRELKGGKKESFQSLLLEDQEPETAAETEYEDDATEIEDEEEDTAEEDDDDDEGAEAKGLMQNYYSMAAMKNKTRLQVFFMLCKLYKAIGEIEKMCEMGVPICLVLLRQQTRHFKWFNRKLQPTEASLEDQSLGVKFLSQNYLVDLFNVEMFKSRVGVITRVACELSLLTTFGPERMRNFCFEIFQSLIQLNKIVPAIDFLLEASNLKGIGNSENRMEMRLQVMITALQYGEKSCGYECARAIVNEDIMSTQYWNFFSFAISKTGLTRVHQKFLARMLLTRPDHLPLMFMSAHVSSSRDQSTLAIGEYTLSFEASRAHAEHFSSHGVPKSEIASQSSCVDPLVALCLAAALLNSVMNRKVTDRQERITKSMSLFYEYRKFRLEREREREEHVRLNHDVSGADEVLVVPLPTPVLRSEISYNLGRAFQQLGLHHLAIPHYENVFRIYDEQKEKGAEQPSSAHAIVRETAFNMSLMYRKSGSDELARHLIQKYLTLD